MRLIRTTLATLLIGPLGLCFTSSALADSADLAAANASLERVEAEVESASKELDEFKELRESEKKALDKANAEIRQATKEVEAIKDKIENVRFGVEKLGVQRMEAENQLDEVKRTQEVATTNMENADKKRSELEAKILELQKQTEIEEVKTGQIQNQMAQVEQVNATVKEKYDLALTDLENAKLIAETKKAKLLAAEEESNRLHLLSEKVKVGLAQARLINADLEKKQEMNQQKIEQINNDMKLMAQTETEALNDIKAKKITYAALDTQAKALAGKLELKKQDFEKVETEQKSVNARLEKRKNYLAKLTEKDKTFSENILTIKEDIAKIILEKKALRQEVKLAKRKLNKLKQRKKKLAERHLQQKEGLDKLGVEKVTLQEKISYSNEDLGNWETKIEEMKVVIAQHDKRIQEYRENEKLIQSKIRKAQKQYMQLKQKKNNKLAAIKDAKFSIERAKAVEKAGKELIAGRDKD